MANQQRQFNFNPILGLLVIFLFLFGIFYITKSLLSLLWWIAPVLFIATLIIDHKVVIGYGKSLIKLFKSNPLFGIIGAVLSVVGIHLVVAFLFGKALLKRKVQKMMGNPNKGEIEFTEFEEVEELELPTLTKPKKERSSYDNLFEE